MQGGPALILNRVGRGISADVRIATTSLTGVASFAAGDFVVTNGQVSIKDPGVTGIAFGNDGISLTGQVTLTAGSNVTITRTSNQITIASSGSGGGGATTSALNTWTQTQTFNGGIQTTGLTSTGGLSASGGLFVTGGANIGGGAFIWGGVFVTGNSRFSNNVNFDNVLFVNSTVNSYAATTFWNASTVTFNNGFVVNNTDPTFNAGIIQTSPNGVTFTGNLSAPNIVNRVIVGGATLTGNVSLTSGSNVTMTVAGNQVTIASSGSVGGGATGDTINASGPSQLVFRTGNMVNLDNRIATSGATGVAAFNSTDFNVSGIGVVSAKNFFNGVTGDTINASGPSQLVFRTGNMVNLDNRIATSGATGVAAFNSTYYSVDAFGNVTPTSGFQVTGDSFMRGGAALILNRVGRGISADVRIATSGATGVAAFNSTNFSVDVNGNVTPANITVSNGNGIGIGGGTVTLGGTVTINNTGVTGIGFGGDYGLTGKINLTAGSGVTITRSGNQITIASGSVGGGDTVYGDSGSVVVSNPSANNKYVTVKHTTSSYFNADGTIANVQPNDGKPHGVTGVATFDANHFIVNANVGSVRIANPAFTFAGSGFGASANSDGSLAYPYLDVGNLTAASESLDASNDAILYYDASTNTTKKIVPQQFLLDQASLFTIDADTPASIEADAYQEFSALAPQIKFSIPPGTISAGSSGFARGSAVYSYVGANTVASANGCTGALTITGTINEIEVTKSCPTLIIGLPDNVRIPYLSVTGATFSQTVTANLFVGTVSGGDF